MHSTCRRCDVQALAPICKLRNLRTFSLEKNRLTRIPPLIGTMLSLRHLLLYSNQLIELPACLCLITGLEVLDVHKNMITALPSIIGKMTSLKKLDVSSGWVKNGISSEGRAALEEAVSGKEGFELKI